MVSSYAAPRLQRFEFILLTRRHDAAPNDPWQCTTLFGSNKKPTKSTNKHGNWVVTGDDGRDYLIGMSGVEMEKTPVMFEG